MAKKTDIRKEQKKPNALMIIVAVLIIAFTPFVKPVLNAFGLATCKQDEFGHCGLGEDMGIAIFSTFMSFVCLAIGVTLLIVAIVNRKK